MPGWDWTEERTGRLYLSGMECLTQAVKSRGLERSLKTAIPESIFDALKEEMSRIDKK